MKNVSLLFIFSVVFWNCQTKQQTTEPESPNTESQKRADVIPNDWVSLFDGNTFDGWHYFNSGAIEEPWKIEDGVMTFYPPKEKTGKGYNIVTQKEYTNFELSLEWRISEGGNSGIFWGVKEGEEFHSPYQTGPEIQVLDDDRHPDAHNGTTHQAGALYDMIAPSVQAVKPAGEWNHVLIHIHQGENQGYVLLNTQKVVEFPLHGAEWEAMVAKSKFADWDGFGEYRTGKIGLQDHGDVVSFRNIKIKEL